MVIFSFMLVFLSVSVKLFNVLGCPGAKTLEPFSIRQEAECGSEATDITL